MDWKEWSNLLSEVIEKIMAQYQPDILIPAMNGGLVPAGIIAARLNIKDVRPVSIGRKGEDRYFIYPDMGYVRDITDKRILIVEDDVPTGKSIRMLKAHLFIRQAKAVKVACVFKATGLKDIDFFAREMPAASFPEYPWKITNLGDRK